MARPIKPLPAVSSPLVDLARDLRQLRDSTGGATLMDMSRVCGMSTAALSKTQSGHYLPTWNAVSGYVTACGGDPSEWRDRWLAARLDQAPEHVERGTMSRRKCIQRWVSTGKMVPPPVKTADQLREVLRWLLHFYDLSLREVAAKSTGYSHSSYHAALAGYRDFTPALLRSLLLGCGVRSTPSLEAWLLALGRTGSEALNTEVFQYIDRTRQAVTEQSDRNNHVEIRSAAASLNTAVRLMSGEGDPFRMQQHYQRTRNAQHRLLLGLSRDVLRAEHILPSGNVVDPQALTPFLRGRAEIPEHLLALLVNSLTWADVSFRRQVFQTLRTSSDFLARGLAHWMTRPLVPDGQLMLFPASEKDSSQAA
ncbi:helix-turn-helix domain-containing protein [Streptomyces sp. NPDC006704]|uniref:helix-turn-helix domain-containing protein n=1 Tax=Streptomyces sp. NPDC006704 TaxID=3364760 RepID=UPI00367744EC